MMNQACFHPPGVPVVSLTWVDAAPTGQVHTSYRKVGAAAGSVEYVCSCACSCVCVRVCMHVCVCVCACVYVHARARAHASVLVPVVRLVTM